MTENVPDKATQLLRIEWIAGGTEAMCTSRRANGAGQDREMKMRNRPNANETALQAFIARKTEIDAMLARLTQLSDDHFGADPDAITWGDVGTLSSYAEQLKRITDSAFKEGEHAA